MIPYIDVANTMMDRRNTLQRKRRVEMTKEQLEEKRRKSAEYQRQYRARKKAALQNSTTTSNANEDNAGIIVDTSSPAGKNDATPCANSPIASCSPIACSIILFHGIRSYEFGDWTVYNYGKR